MKFFFYKIITLVLIISSNAHADVVRKIDISGNDRISNNTIIDIIDFKKSNNYSNSDLNNFQKKLFETNFFSDVNLKLEDDILKIIVIENPLIEFFIIQGVINKTREDLIYEKVLLGQNKIFSQSLLNQDIEIIKKIFSDAGYFNASVFPEISKLPNGNLNIALNVNREEQYKIKRIFFIGDKYFKSSTLSDVVSSSEHGWWKFLSSSSTVNMNRIEFDKQLLKNFYLNEGFYDVQILSSDISFEEKNKASITFSVNSGKKYDFSEFSLIDSEKNLNKQDFDTINEFIASELDGNFSNKKINNLRQKIYTYLNLRKIEFVKFNILPKKTENNLITTNIIIEKTARNFVNNIDVKGNSITEEEVIRRELIFSEGDAFSRYKLEKSEDNLKSSGIFKEVKTNIKNLNNESVDIEVNVEEQPTGAISAGVGVGSSGASVSAGVSEKNLFGKGINVNSNIILGTENIKGNILTSIPDFKNTDNDFLFDVYVTATDFENAGYESTVVGSSTAIKYDLYEDITFKPGIGINRDSIDTNSTASDLYRSREGDYLTFLTFYNLETDKRDKRFQTTKGYKVNFGQNLAVPGSDIPYIENNISGSFYHPVNKDYILSLKSGLNSINAFNNKDVKLSDRKFLSNRNLRGFENYGVGPKDGKDHIGGNYSAYSSIASTVPNPLPDKWNANSIVFLDVGNVWGVDYDSSIDSDKIRSSAGLGLDWISPLGPLSFVFAQTLSSADGDLEESFSFQIGSSF
ncbi:outer membrane protein assembly factor BamA [Pelagibacteraceae bacterium]|nr:outer membrane protein assembly factor BamA [Pelagibacteraceae bacterium]